MLEIANREIRRAVETEEVRRREAARLPALTAALDDLLSELEELTVIGTVTWPSGGEGARGSSGGGATGRWLLPRAS